LYAATNRNLELEKQLRETEQRLMNKSLVSFEDDKIVLSRDKKTKKADVF
jgi:hypothetical protein